MKGSREYSKRLNRFLTPLRKKVRKSDLERQMDSESEVIEELVVAVLEENAAAAPARSAYRKIMASMVDFNDLRVTTPQDLARSLDRSISNPTEKAQRLSMILNHIFDKKNSLSLDSLRKDSRREARKFLNLLEGITPFVSATVVQRSLGGHAIPVDEAVLGFLVDNELVPENTSIEDVQSFLERHVVAADVPLFLTEVRRQALAHYRRSRSARSAPKTATKSSKANRSTAKVKTATKKTATRRVATKARANPSGGTRTSRASSRTPRRKK